MNNKELINAGHKLAKAISSDTPIIDMAKMFTRLAERLDCTTAALREMTKLRDALAAENTGLKSVVSEIHNELYGHGFQVSGWHLNGDLEPLDSWFEENNWNPETPATEDFLSEVRAHHGESICVSLIEKANEYDARAKEVGCHTTDNRYRFAAAMFRGFALQLRKGVQS